MDGDGKWNEPNWMGMETRKWSVNSNYDPKQCWAWQTIENYPLQLFGGMQILSMQLQTLWTPCTAACGPCQTENCDNPNNSQEVDEEEDDNQNWTLWNLFLWTKVFVHYVVIVDSWR